MSVTVQTPTGGTLPILGAVVAGTLEGGVFTPISGGGGSGVVNGQQLKDNAGVVFLDAGAHTIRAEGMWYLNADGSVGFSENANNTSCEIDPNGNMQLNSVNVAGTAFINADGSANFSGGISSTRITQRVETLTDAATVTPSTDSHDGGILTELSQDSTIANPTGTPTDQQRYLLRIKSTTSRALTWGSEYRGSTGIPLATATTGGGKVDYFVLIRDVADSKWHVMPNTGF